MTQRNLNASGLDAASEARLDGVSDVLRKTYRARDDEDALSSDICALMVSLSHLPDIDHRFAEPRIDTTSSLKRLGRFLTGV